MKPSKRNLLYVVVSLIAALSVILLGSREERPGARRGLFGLPHVLRAGLLPQGEARSAHGTPAAIDAGLDAAWPAGIPAPPPGANTHLDATQFQGADAGRKIKACFDALPSTGGACDARNMDMHQDWSENPFDGQPKDKLLVLRLGGTNISVSHQIKLGNNRYIVGTLGASAKGQLPTGTIFTPTAGFTGKSVFQIDPTYAAATLSFGLGAAIVDVAVDMKNIPTQTWGGTVFEINSLTHQELYGLRAVNNNGTFMVLGTSPNSVAQWCEDLNIHDFYSSGTATVLQTAPVMEIDALQHSTIRNGRLFSAKSMRASPDPSSVDLLLQGGAVADNRFDNLRITAAWTGVKIQNLPERGGFNGYNPPGTPIMNEFINSDQEGFHYGYYISGSAQAHADWILIDNPDFSTPYGASPTAIVLGNYTEYSTVIASNFGTAVPTVILGPYAFSNMLWVMSPEAVVDQSAGSNLIFGRKNQTGTLWVNHGIEDKGTPFSQLGNRANGALLYCPDCSRTNPCGPGGSGAFAKRLGGMWLCN